MSSRSRFALFAALTAAVTALVLPAAASALRPDLSFSSLGPGAGQIASPIDAVVAPDGSVYIGDFANRRIDVFAPDGTFLFAFGKNIAADGTNANRCTPVTGCKIGSVDSSAGSLGAPEGVVIDSKSSRIYIANLGDNRVDAYTLDGRFLFAFGEKVNPQPLAAEPDICTVATGCREGAPGTGAGGHMEPKGIEVGFDGNVYVADRRNDRIDVFSPEGKFLFAFGGGVNQTDGSDICTAASGCKDGSTGAEAGDIREPFDVKAGPEGAIYVADPNNSRVEVYTPGGVFQRAFGKGVNATDGSNTCDVACKGGVATGTGALRAASMEIDGAGTLFAVDPANDWLTQFSIAGQFQQAYGQGVLDGAATFQTCLPTDVCLAGTKEGKVPGAVTDSLGIALDCRRGIYTVEAFAERANEPVTFFARVQRFTDPNPVCSALHPPSPLGGGEPPKADPPKVAVPLNEFSFGKLALNRRKGTATLQVTVPGPGSLVLKGKGIRTARATAKRAGAVRLVVNPVGPAKRRLLKAAKAKLRATVTFAPSGGTPLTKQRPLTLRIAG